MVGKWLVFVVYFLVVGIINCLLFYFIGVRNVLILSEVFLQYVQLDVNGSFYLYWKINVIYIIFEVYVRIWGYVGFGLFFNGDMYLVDIVIGWVKYGYVYLQVRNI